MRRKAVLIFGAIALIWVGWWGIASFVMQHVISDWVDARRAEGWQVDIAQSGKTGFPFRIGADLREISMQNPDTGKQISAPHLRLSAPIYLPGDIRVTLPAPPLGLTTARGIFRLGFEGAQGGLRVAQTPALTLDSMRVGAEQLTLSFEDDPIATLGRVTALAKETEAPGTYKLTADARDLVLAPQINAAIGRADELATGITQLAFNGTLGFDTPWDRTALVRRSPLPTSIRITQAEAVWGGVALRLSADLDVGADGHLSGDIRVATGDWRTMLTLMARSGAINTDQEPQIEAMLSAVSGGRDALDVPVTVDRGRLRIGFLPLGRLPRVFVPYLQ